MKSTVPTRLQITRGQRMGVRPPKIDPTRGYPLINQTGPAVPYYDFTG